MSTTSSVATLARFEAAIETLAEYIGFLYNEIDAEQNAENPNSDRVLALQEELNRVLQERQQISPALFSLINRALYIYAPTLKHSRST